MCLFLLVILASPLQTYLSRRASVAAALREQSQLQSTVASLQQQTQLWNDPAYIARQARARLQYVRPGDTLYTVLGLGSSTSADAAAAESKPIIAIRQPSWNAALWSSVLSPSKSG
jgi:hypothetical protein